MKGYGAGRYKVETNFPGGTCKFAVLDQETGDFMYHGDNEDEVRMACRDFNAGTKEPTIRWRMFVK